MNAIIFDFDDTLCKGQSINGFIKLLIKKLGIYVGLKYYLFRLITPYKNNQYPAYKEFLLRAFKDVDQSIFESCALEYSQQLIEHQLHRELISKLTTYQQQEDCVTILSSGGFEIYLTFISTHLGFDYLNATQLEFKDGKFTGKIMGLENLEQQKLVNFKKNPTQFSNITMYTDSLNDLPLIEISNQVFIVHPKDRKPLWMKDAWQSIEV